jgi:hypothetical protein
MLYQLTGDLTFRSQIGVILPTYYVVERLSHATNDSHSSLRQAVS